MVHGKDRCGAVFVKRLVSLAASRYACTHLTCISGKQSSVQRKLETHPGGINTALKSSLSCCTSCILGVSNMSELPKCRRVSHAAL